MHLGNIAIYVGRAISLVNVIAAVLVTAGKGSLLSVVTRSIVYSFSLLIETFLHIYLNSKLGYMPCDYSPEITSNQILFKFSCNSEDRVERRLKYCIMQ
jgi:hypothetical protein